MLRASSPHFAPALDHLARHRITPAVGTVARAFTIAGDGYGHDWVHLQQCKAADALTGDPVPVPARTWARARRDGTLSDLVCHLCATSRFTGYPALAEYADAPTALLYSLYVDELFDGRVRNRMRFRHLETGLARLLDLLHPRATTETMPYDLADLVNRQRDRLATWQPGWAARLQLRRYQPGSTGWMLVRWAPLNHLSGLLLDEEQQVVLAAIGAAPQTVVLPERAGGGLLVQIPTDLICEHDRWRGRHEVLPWIATRADVDHLVLALQLRESDPDTPFESLLEAATAAS